MVRLHIVLSESTNDELDRFIRKNFYGQKVKSLIIDTAVSSFIPVGMEDIVIKQIKEVQSKKKRKSILISEERAEAEYLEKGGEVDDR